MGYCEICGSANVTSREVLMEKASVDACTRCIEKMKLIPTQKTSGIIDSLGENKSSSFSGKGKIGKDIMAKNNKELVNNFALIIKKGRKNKGLNKRELARIMAEKLNVIQSIEKGNIPTDALIKKFEHALDITLMEERKAEQNQMINRNSGRSMTLGDYFKENK